MQNLSNVVQRFDDQAKQLASTLFYGLLRATAGMVIFCLIMFLRITKPLILYPLVLAMIGGVGATIAFGLNHHWTDAAEAFSVGLAAWVVTTAYAALARRLDPTFFDVSPLPPWWWYL